MGRGRRLRSSAARTKRFLGVSIVSSSNLQATRPRANNWWRSVVRTSILPRTRLSIRLDQALLFSQRRFALMSVLASSMIFLMRAVMATFGGLPALIMAWYLALRSGLNLIATSAGM